MRSWLGFYNHEHKSSAEFLDCLNRNAHDYGLCEALKFYLAGDDDYQRRIRNVHHERTLWGAAIALYRVLELEDLIHPDSERVDHTLEFLKSLTKSKSPKLQSLAAPLAAEFFDFLKMRKNQEAIAHAASKIIGWANDHDSQRALHLIVAPKVSLAGAGETCLFVELREAIERNADFSGWLEESLPPRLRLRAFQSTGFPELRKLATRNQRGKILEDDLGM